MKKVKTAEWGIFGPFESSDDLSELWYLAELQSLKEDIDQAKSDAKENPEGEGYLKDLEYEYKNLSHFVENHTRLVERYKFDKKALNEIEDDWNDYNLTLYGRWSRLQSAILGGHLDREKLQNAGKSDKIKLEEIERRFKLLLDAK